MREFLEQFEDVLDEFGAAAGVDVSLVDGTATLPWKVMGVWGCFAA